jgi:hypothetical protein
MELEDAMIRDGLGRTHYRTNILGLDKIASLRTHKRPRFFGETLHSLSPLHPRYLILKMLLPERKL